MSKQYLELAPMQELAEATLDERAESSCAYYCQWCGQELEPKEFCDCSPSLEWLVEQLAAALDGIERDMSIFNAAEKGYRKEISRLENEAEKWATKWHELSTALRDQRDDNARLNSVIKQLTDFIVAIEHAVTERSGQQFWLHVQEEAETTLHAMHGTTWEG